MFPNYGEFHGIVYTKSYLVFHFPYAGTMNLDMKQKESYSWYLHSPQFHLSHINRFCPTNKIGMRGIYIIHLK